MRKRTVSIFSLLVLGGLTACQQNDVTSSDDSILQSNQADIQSYATSKGLTGSMTNTGVYVALTKTGTSTVTPANGQEVEFNYSIYALVRNSSNVVVDSFVDSTYTTKSSYAYLVATNAGLTEGLLRMHENDQAVVLLPSAYAFGTTGSSDGKVPPNAPVRLNVTLKRIRTEDQQINEYMTANQLTPTEVTLSGLRFIKTVSNPTGIAPTANQTLNVRYRGTLLRSQSAFDSTGTGTYGFTLGQSVPGFDEGLAKLKVGEKAILILPSKIGYGSAGRSVIPPYAPMRFDVELVSAQ
ncbi:FKBP-type peptidyl-prolyl cis-trans isomerase [Spirosoma radiotolerans]|uniref:Peptidyl-prolyl cis-trans isomerase n=1 Tax=Spirosoma radiotolerans TaxID=1379870 RepID=A0A0E3ZZ77_9BACT|nr:FKBP-type peptidyl-prolyl cis-trans isomerase [Spirosoma radiotolerans]AKD57493.1 FKBP-type peptidylprolyl isomerase [Spirosoma radiotolerans]